MSDKEKKAKNGVHAVIDEYYDLDFFKMKPINIAYIERLAKDYVLFFEKNETAVSKNAFINHRRIGSRRFYDWLKKYEPLANANEQVESLIFERVHKGMLERRYSEKGSFATLLSYDSEWDTKQEKQAKLASKFDEGSKVINIIKPDYSKED